VRVYQRQPAKVLVEEYGLEAKVTAKSEPNEELDPKGLAL